MEAPIYFRNYYVFPWKIPSTSTKNKEVEIDVGERMELGRLRYVEGTVGG